MNECRRISAVLQKIKIHVLPYQSDSDSPTLQRTKMTRPLTQAQDFNSEFSSFQNVLRAHLEGKSLCALLGAASRGGIPPEHVVRKVRGPSWVQSADIEILDAEFKSAMNLCGMILTLGKELFEAGNFQHWNQLMRVRQLNDILVNARHKTLGPGCPQEIIKANNQLTFALTVYRNALLPLMSDFFNKDLRFPFHDCETKITEATKFFLSVSIFENHRDPIAPE